MITIRYANAKAMTKIEIKHLNLIKNIAETGNLTRAAEKLCLTQSAISQQLQDIEEKLEAPLFFRTSKKMILTPAGERLFQTAQGILDQLRIAELDIGKLVHGETGLLRIGTTCVFSYKWLPLVMKQLQKLFPKVDIEMKTSLDVIADLKERRLDLVITTMSDDNPHLSFETIFSDEIVITLSANDPLTAKPFLNLTDFQGKNLISYTDDVKGDLYRDYLAPVGIEPAKIIRVNQPEAALELVKNGFGISVFPRWTIKAAMKSKEICARSFTKKGFFMQWKVVCWKKSDIPSHHREFIRLMKEETIMLNS